MADGKPSTETRRPSPKAMLELAAKEHRGKLKVFLGMAPGVGKTYAMLAAARSLKEEGVDVLVGVVETHGRAETARLLEGLEVLPRKPVDYRRRTLMEFDIEAAIARRPKLLLIDELAHSNAPGLIHVKRHQDVEEALRNGIDVWTTLNVQHLESLQDVVERITGVRVQESIPDKVLETADEIVVVDLTPDELIQRLKEGKVYLPENARRAVDRFFKPRNLTALRELALRRTADRVDEQMLAQLRQQGIEGPWPTAERILVCSGSDPHSEAVIRTAARLATAQKADWIALHLRPSSREVMDRATGRRAERMLRLAERLGANTVRLNADDLASAILDYARRSNITQIVIGRGQTGLFGNFGRKSLSRTLIESSDGLAILVVSPSAPGKKRRVPLALPPRGELTTGTIAAAVAVAAAVSAGAAVERVTSLPNLSMVFLLAVLVCAMSFGLCSALASALLSFFAYNFFFIDPRYSFTIAEPYELFSLIVFLVVAFVTGTMASRLSAQAAALRERAEVTQALYDFSRKLSAMPDLDEALRLVAEQTAASVKGKSVVLLEGDTGLAVSASWPSDDAMGASVWAAARWAHERQEPAGLGTATLPTARYHFRPMPGTTGAIGVVGVEPADGDAELSEATLAMLQSFIEQAGTAIERIMLARRAAAARTAAESDKLRGALLASISHDLRTPLASIVGSATSLKALGARMSKSDRRELLSTIEEEATRLSRFVTNLLDMSKLEAGVDVRRDPVDVGGVVEAAVERAGRTHPTRKIEVSLPNDLPPVVGDAALLEQVVFNLLDNAHKYNPSPSPTRIAARPGDAAVRLTVDDDGIGIPPEALPKVFEKFYRAAGSDGRAPGTGLGLSICAAIVHAMGGTISAHSPVAGNKGTRIVVELPAMTGRNGQS